MIDIAILNKLNAPTKEERLANLKEVLKDTPFPPMVPQYINNHIHTTYSFSPYSPTAISSSFHPARCLVPMQSIEVFISFTPIGRAVHSRQIA